MPSCTASNPSHDFMLVHPLFCNDDRAGEIGPTFHFMTRHDLVLANDRTDQHAGLQPELMATSPCQRLQNNGVPFFRTEPASRMLEFRSQRPAIAGAKLVARNLL